MAQIAPDRILVRDVMSVACMKYPSWAELDAVSRDTALRRLERGCCSHTIKTCERDGIDRLFTDKRFVDRYSASTSRVINALRSSPVLIEGIIRGSIDCEAVATLPMTTLCPSAGEAERAIIEQRRNQKYHVKVSRMYRCRKCGGCETMPIDYQSRAPDEMASRSVKCVACGNVQRE